MNHTVEDNIAQANAQERHHYRYHRWAIKGAGLAFAAYLFWDAFIRTC